MARADAPEKPSYYQPVEMDELQEIERTPASPCFVHHPATDSTTSPTVIFLAGGFGTRRGAQRVWSNYFSEGLGVEAFRLVAPYSPDEFGFETVTILAVLDEVLACYGGDAEKIHIAGLSNGGIAVFGAMLLHPERFASLLGGPGWFQAQDPARWAKAL